MKLLLVEDDKNIRTLLQGALVADGYETLEAGSAEEAMELAVKHRFDAYLLDVMLPGQSGNDLCRWLRDQGTQSPILLLTARSGLSEKVESLDAGADDYLTKPFEIAEVRARLRAALRKTLGYPRPPLQVGDLIADPNTRTARRGDQALDLSKKEYALLEYLLRNKDRLVTREMIANVLWDSGTGLYTNVIDVLMNSLRKKVEGGMIKTVRGKAFMIS